MFSEAELEVTRWFAQQLGIPDLPTIKQIKDHRAKILALAGANSQTVESQMHNFYTHNDIKTIIAHVSLRDRIALF